MRLSDTATSIITLLNNANDLITISSDRQNADRVIRAIRVYANNKRFPIPEEMMDNFSAVLLDAKPYTLTSILKDIAFQVVKSDNKDKSQKKIS